MYRSAVPVVISQHRSTQRRPAVRGDDEDALTAAIVDLASEYAVTAIAGSPRCCVPRDGT